MYETTFVRGDVGDPLRNLISDLLKEYKLKTFLLGRHVALKIDFVNLAKPELLKHYCISSWTEQLKVGIPALSYLRDTELSAKVGLHTSVAQPEYIEIFFGAGATYDEIDGELKATPIIMRDIEFEQVAKVYIKERERK